MNALTVVRKHFPDVKTVKDAKSNISVEVTKQDVAISKRGKHKECAMAVACKRKMKLDGVLIARSIGYVIKGNTATRFKIPTSLSREVTSFDRGASFEPGTYSLAKPDKALGTRKRSGKHSRSGKGPQFHHFTVGIRAVLGGRDARA